MTWVDAAAISVIVLSAVFSLVRGFVREMLAVVAWLGAAFLAVRLYPVVLPYVASVLPLKNLQLPISLGVVFIVALIVLSIISAYIGGVVRDSALSGLDRSLGIVFGTVRGVIIVCVAYIGLSIFVQPADWPPPVNNARLLPYAFEGAKTLTDLLPSNYRPSIMAPPYAKPPSAGSLMQQPVAGSALRTE